MAQTLSIDLQAALLGQQYGTSTTADAERGIVAQRRIKAGVSTFTRSVVIPQLEIAPGELKQIDLGSMGTPRFLIVETDAAITYRVSAADGEAIPIEPLAADLPGVAILSTTGIAGLWLERDGGATGSAVVAVIVAGIE